MSVLFDTNILIDYVKGIPNAVKEVRRQTDALISVVTWIEVMSGARTEVESDRLRRFLLKFERLDLNPEIAEAAAVLRQESKLKLPDAVILATAQVHQVTLLTRNTSGFPENAPGIRVPYKL